MTKKGFEAYVMYLAMQKHFSTNYDFFQYNGKVKVSTEAYSKRNDMFSFEKLTKLVPEEDLIDFYVCHFLENPKEWIRNMNKTNLEIYRSKMKNLSKIFRDDLQTIALEGVGRMMACEGNGIPKIHNLMIANTIELETGIIIDAIVPYVDKHADEIQVPFVFPDHIKKMKKYRPFLVKKIGTETINTVMKDVFKDVLVNQN